MADQAQPPPAMRTERSETSATDSSSGHSVQDVHPSSPTDPSSSTNPTGTDQQCSSSQSRPGTSAGRKRKVPSSVTPNACTNCKKARAKCDGIKPACRRCVNRKTADSCHYEVHAKTAKEQMVREIQRLQRRNDDLEDTLGERNNRIIQIMHSLKTEGQGTEIINRLKRGESHQNIAESLGRPMVGNQGDPDSSPTTPRSFSQAIQDYYGGLLENHDPRYWTNVTTDANLIEHLITLYFTWIHPVHLLLDEQHFMASFRDCKDTYCSSALVNIICAMSCHLLHDTQDGDERTKSAIISLRSRFIDETQLLMRNIDFGKWTNIQTYAIMFLVEVSSGHGLIASSHLRLAVENLIAKQTSEQSSEAEELAAWGILTLHTAWSGFTYQKPFAPVSTHANPFTNIDLKEGSEMWRLYRQPGDNDILDRPGFAKITAFERAKLFRIIHGAILIYCGSRGKVTAEGLLGIYERYMAWKERLSPELRYDEGEPLPHVLFLHIEYHTAVIQLLQPLLHIDHFQKESFEQLKDLVVNHAQIGLELLIRYQRLYSNFYLSPLQLLCMVHLCDAVVRYDGHGNTTLRTVHFCLTSLEEAKVDYPLAGSLQMMFRQSLSECRIPVPEKLERMIGALGRVGHEEMLDAVTRHTYRQPITQLLPDMEDGIGQGFINGWHQLSEGRSPELPFAERSYPETGERQRRVEIGSLLNA